MCFITASSYLRGPGFVGMRQAMRETFDELWILDFEGESRGARPTENVFNIQTGVAIAIGIRLGAGDKSKPTQTRYAKITGSRAQKFAALDAIQVLADVDWRDCSSDWLQPFQPISEAVYHDWPALTDLFPWQHSGAQFKRSWPIGVTESVLRQRWNDLITAPQDQKAAMFRETRDRTIQRTFRDWRDDERALPLAQETSATPIIERYGFRSFDRQWAIADNRVADFPKPTLWKSYSTRQLFLTSLLTGVLGDGPAATVTAHVPDLHHFSGRGGKDAIPLWRDASATQPNVTGGLLPYLGEALERDISAPDLFAYCYALLSPRAYVRLFAEELLLPGPCIPLTRSPELFARVASCGHDLIRAHTFGERDLESNAPSGEVTPGLARYTATISPEPENYPRDYAYDLATKTLHVGDGAFSPIEPEVWNYSVSGLRVVRSWLDYRKKDRGGRRSSPLDDIRPQSWTSALSDELQDLLWTLERTLEIEPHAESLLQQVLGSDLILASELPKPTQAERDAPASRSDTGQIALDIDDAQGGDAELHPAHQAPQSPHPPHEHAPSPNESVAPRVELAAEPQESAHGHTERAAEPDE